MLFGEVISDKVNKCLFGLVIKLGCNFNNKHDQIDSIVGFVIEVNLIDELNEIECLMNKFKIDEFSDEYLVNCMF